jgi:hypothetical protein
MNALKFSFSCEKQNMKLCDFLGLFFILKAPCARLLAEKLTESGSKTFLQILTNIKGDRIGIGSRPLQDWINHTDPEVGKATREKASKFINSLPKYMEDHPDLSQDEAMKRLVLHEVSCQMSMKTFVPITNADTRCSFEESLLVSAVSAVSSESEPSDLESDSDSDDGFVVIGQKEQDQ